MASGTPYAARDRWFALLAYMNPVLRVGLYRNPRNSLSETSVLTDLILPDASHVGYAELQFTGNLYHEWYSSNGQVRLDRSRLYTSLAVSHGSAVTQLQLNQDLTGLQVAAGDTVDVALDNGNSFVTQISQVATVNPGALVIAAGLPGPASSGSKVIITRAGVDPKVKWVNSGGAAWPTVTGAYIAANNGQEDILLHWMDFPQDLTLQPNDTIALDFTQTVA